MATSPLKIIASKCIASVATLTLFLPVTTIADSDTPTQPAARQATRNLIMGTGELRAPQHFTRKHRFLQAAREDDRATAERALALGVSVNSRDDLGRSALLLATRDAGSLDLLRFFHHRGAAVDDADQGGRTALSFAAAKGRLDLVQYLVTAGAAIDAVDKLGRSPLFYSAIGNHPDTLLFLINAGADVNQRARFGETPLIAACAKHREQAAALLLAHGADPALRDQEGRTARDRARDVTSACFTTATATP